MNKVVSVNLNGRAYQIEEHGYTALKKYLDQAEARLADNPDREEIIADFEQAIAEKCDELLNDNKTVIGTSEIAAIIEQMGPVDGKEADASDEPSEGPVKRLYLIKEGAIIGGVCNGLATYFNIDVTVVRLVAIVLAFITSGGLILAYIVLMFLIPTAKTPEQRAAAQGKRLNTKELLDSERWKKVANDSKPVLNSAGVFIRQLLRVIAGIVAAFGILSLVGILASGISGIWSLVFSNNLFGYVTFDTTISTSLFAVLLGCGLLVGAIPVFLVTVVAFRYAKYGTIKQNIWTIVSALAVFAVALGIGLAIFSSMPQIRNATIYFKNTTTDEIKSICLGNCPAAPYHKMHDQYYYGPALDAQTMPARPSIGR